MPQYEFEKQFISGKAGEWVMEKYHKVMYDIRKSNRIEERKGFDYTFTKNKSVWKVEVKTDFLAQRYGNIIIETVSVDKHNIPGWALTSQADILIFYLWHLQKVMYFRMGDIKENIASWAMTFGETAKIKNHGYNTIGIKLPIDVAKETAMAIRHPVDPHWMKKNYKAWGVSDGK